MLDLYEIFHQTFNNISIIVITTVSVGIAYKFYICYTNYTLLNRVIQVEAARAQDGLPSEVTITPEDFRLNPELAEILEVTDVNNNINVALETNAHLEYIQFQDTIFAHDLFLENAVAFVANIFNQMFTNNDFMQTVAELITDFL
jgi:hypothetical protein